MPFAFGRYLNTTLHCSSDDVVRGVCTQGIDTNAVGNIGTQFDFFGHIFLVDADKANETDFPSNEYLRIWNNFKGSDVFENYAGDGDVGIAYFGVEKLPMFFTKAILVDVAGYKGVEVLDEYYAITLDDVLSAMQAQNIQASEIGAGDVFLFYTGWSIYYELNTTLLYDRVKTPGIAPEVMLDLLFETNVAIVGSDNWGIDAKSIDPQTNQTYLQAVHNIFLPCGGGFLHELLKLDEWVHDARNGDAPWIGAYVYQPVPFRGGVASPGRPAVFV